MHNVVVDAEAPRRSLVGVSVVGAHSTSRLRLSGKAGAKEWLNGEMNQQTNYDSKFYVLLSAKDLYIMSFWSIALYTIVSL